jgi:hypothetical protein
MPVVGSRLRAHRTAESHAPAPIICCCSTHPAGKQALLDKTNSLYQAHRHQLARLPLGLSPALDGVGKQQQQLRQRHSCVRQLPGPTL